MRHKGNEGHMPKAYTENVSETALLLVSHHSVLVQTGCSLIFYYVVAQKKYA